MGLVSTLDLEVRLREELALASWCLTVASAGCVGYWELLSSSVGHEASSNYQPQMMCVLHVFLVTSDVCLASPETASKIPGASNSTRLSK